MLHLRQGGIDRRCASVGLSIALLWRLLGLMLSFVLMLVLTLLELLFVVSIRG